MIWSLCSNFQLHKIISLKIKFSNSQILQDKNIGPFDFPTTRIQPIIKIHKTLKLTPLGYGEVGALLFYSRGLYQITIRLF